MIELEFQILEKIVAQSLSVHSGAKSVSIQIIQGDGFVVDGERGFNEFGKKMRLCGLKVAVEMPINVRRAANIVSPLLAESRRGVSENTALVFAGCRGKSNPLYLWGGLASGDILGRLLRENYSELKPFRVSIHELENRSRVTLVNSMYEAKMFWGDPNDLICSWSK